MRSRIRRKDNDALAPDYFRQKCRAREVSVYATRRLDGGPGPARYSFASHF
jgi:hypothetical protein